MKGKPAGSAVDMEYVAIGILVLLVVGGGITMLVLSSTKNSAPAAAEDDSKSAGAPFEGTDSTPLGDTEQHAGQTDPEGVTHDNDASEHGGTGAPTSGPHPAGRTAARPAEEPEGGRFKRDPVGGEAEGEPTAPVGEAPHPDSR